MDTLDGVIPAPNNKMVDLDHRPIATAWQECRKVLLSYDDMQSKHDTLMRRWSDMVETIRKKIDAGTLSMEDRQLLEDLNLPHRYDKRISKARDFVTQDSLTYQDIVPELNAICRTYPDCWHIPATECPFIDICQRDDFKGEGNGCAEFEAAVLARYKELCKNPPLTLEELKHSCGKPVFIKFLRAESPGEWKVVRCITDSAVKFTDETSLNLPDASSHVSCYGRDWLAYNHELKECEG